MTEFKHAKKHVITDTDHRIPEGAAENDVLKVVGGELVMGPAVAGPHTHLEADITDLGPYASDVHTHLEADITDLGSYLDETAHDLLDHTGLTGIPSIAGLLDEPAHDLLDHTGLPGVGGSGPHTILSADHTDSTVSVPSDGDVLTWDTGTSKWVASAPTGGGSPVTVTKQSQQIRVPLYANTLLVDTASWDVQNIDQTYDHLEIHLMVRGTAASGTTAIAGAFNNDTTNANYIQSGHYAGNAHGAGTVDANRYFGEMVASTAPAGVFTPNIIIIEGYAGTTWHKKTINKYSITSAATTQYTNEIIVSWKNTAAINRITFTPQAGNFLAGSKIRIIGVKTQDVVTDVVGAASTEPTVIKTAYSNALDSHTANSTWEAVNSMSVSLTTGDITDIICDFTTTVEFYSSNWEHYMFRFVLDGATYSETWGEYRDNSPAAGNPRYLRSMHSVFENVAAGVHTVIVQWQSASQLDCRFRERRLTILSVPR